MIILSILRSSLTIIYRFGFGVKPNLNWIEILQLIGATFNTLFSYISVSAFLLFYLRDLKLKHYLQLQCRYMIDIKKS